MLTPLNTNPYMTPFRQPIVTIETGDGLVAEPWHQRMRLSRGQRFDYADLPRK